MNWSPDTRDVAAEPGVLKTAFFSPEYPVLIRVDSSVFLIVDSMIGKSLIDNALIDDNRLPGSAKS